LLEENPPIASYYASYIRDANVIRDWEACVTKDAAPGLFAYGSRDDSGSTFVNVAWTPGPFAGIAPRVQVDFVRDPLLTIFDQLPTELGVGSGRAFAVSHASGGKGFTVTVTGVLRDASGNAVGSFRSAAMVPPTTLERLKQWVTIGSGTDVGCGTSDCWMLGSRRAPLGGYYVHRWNGTGWDVTPGAGVAIDSGPGGPWLVNDGGYIFRWNGSDWTNVPGGARDIGVGADGSVWILGTGRAPIGGTEVWRRSGSTWQKTPGAGVAIDVAPDGLPWLVNDEGKIFRWDGGAWNELAGRARDIAVGPDGSVYIVSQSPRDDGDAVMKWSGSGWTEVPSTGARRITVRPDGALFIVSATGAVRTLPR
jgi:hypothetical protein